MALALGENLARFHFAQLREILEKSIFTRPGYKGTRAKTIRHECFHRFCGPSFHKRASDLLPCRGDRSVPTRAANPAEWKGGVSPPNEWNSISGGCFVRQAKPEKEEEMQKSFRNRLWDPAGNQSSPAKRVGSRNRVLRGGGVTHPAKRTQGVCRPCDRAPKEVNAGADAVPKAEGNIMV